MEKKKRCSYCRNMDQSLFVHVKASDDIVCTVCSCVQRNLFISNHTVFAKDTSPGDRPRTAADARFLDGHHRLITNVFPKEERLNKRRRKISRFCDKLDLPAYIRERSLTMFTEFQEELCKFRPIDRVLLTCVVVAARSSDRFFLPISKVMDLFETFTTDMVQRVCRALGINQRTITLSSVPYVVSMLDLPFSCEKELTDNYNKVCRLAPSVCGETKMGIAACRVLKDHDKEIDLEYVASLTDATANSIKNFLSKKRKRGSS